MGELIKIDNDNKVDGRSLHEFLQIETPFKKWIDRMLEYGFVEGVDYWTEDKKVCRADGVVMPQKQTEYILTIDMAKEISMIQRTERGKQARLYFIECEKRLKHAVQDSYMIADPVERAKRWIEEMKVRQQQAEQITEMKPKALFADAVSASKTSILIRDLAKLLSQNGITIGQNRLYEVLRQRGYLIKGGSDKNMPTQRAMEMKLFEIKEGTRLDGNGVNVTTRTTKVTGKGQIYFVNKFLKEKEGEVSGQQSFDGC